MPRELQYKHRTTDILMEKYRDGSTTVTVPGQTFTLKDADACHQLIALLIIAESHPQFSVQSFWMQLLTVQRQCTSIGSLAYDALERIIHDICWTMQAEPDE